MKMKLQTARLEQRLIALANQLGLATFQIFDKIASLCEFIVCRVGFLLEEGEKISQTLQGEEVRKNADLGRKYRPGP